MMKFFRRIRRKLINEGKLKRYLIYAVGEILLVMIGILLALQVNTWNEQGKVKKEEKIALNDLFVEFQRNKHNFLIHSKRERDIESSWHDYLAVISNFQLPDSVRSQDRPRLGYSTFKISNNKLKSLLATGYIDRIQSDTLKQLLLNWEDILLTYQGLEDDHLKHAKESLIPIEQKIKPNSRIKMISGIETSFYTPQEEQTIAIDALKNMSYQNGLIQNYHWLRLKVNRHERIINHLDRTIEQLKNSMTDNGKKY